MGTSKYKKSNEQANIKINDECISDTHGKPINKEEIEELYRYESAICIIKVENSGSGTGFFCEINDEAIPFKIALFTNNHVLNEESIDINKEIKIEYCKEEKILKITENRKVFTNKDLDYTCIEIFDSDKINKFFKFDENLLNDKNTLKNKGIFILQYPNGELSHDSGIISDTKNDIFIHSVSTDMGSSGSPLMKRDNINFIIGIHRGGNESSGNKYNYATFFDAIIKDIKFQISNKNIIEFRNTINLKYEKSKDEDSNNNIFGAKFVENNKKNIILKINGKKSELIEKYNLKEGINIIQIIIKNKLISLKDMFNGVTSLKNIEEFKYLNTKEVNDFSGIFYNCSKLSDIKPLQSWNVSNGNDFSFMFHGCSSLSDIKSLKNWNVSNGNNFKCMFIKCSSLSDIKALQNWNVSNGNNFLGMFY